MSLTRYINSIKGKLSAEDLQYLDAHPVVEVLAEATKLCDDPREARMLCREALHKYVLQAIQDTNRCPGILTTWAYVIAYEFMSASLRDVSRDASKASMHCVHTLPTKPGAPLTFTLLYHGVPCLFRDSTGRWYSWTGPVSVVYTSTFVAAYRLKPDVRSRAGTYICVDKLNRCYRKHHPEYTTIGRK